jgi:SAM-dependent methyltransferase
MIDAFAYDVVEYPAHVYPQLHPSRLAAIARLHGVHASSPKECRFLEVGCGDGVQLLSLALAYPQARFVGVDLSQAAIARGEALRVRLGLDNLRLVAADLTQWDAGPERFDFIVAHGFYSWVPGVVRERLMALCGTHLADAGIACISYNALPGSHLRRMLWDIMKFHSGAAANPRERVASAIECLDLLLLGMPGGKHYASAMSAEIAELKDRLDANVLFHDDLAEVNEPFTLDQFIQHAGRHGLGFLAEASYHEMSLRNASEEVRPLLAEIARNDIVTKEQYLDFFTGRRFRQTLVCRQAAHPRPTPDATVIPGLDIVTEMTADTEAPGADGGYRFSHPASGGLKTEDPCFRTLLDACAARHPHPQPMHRLLAEACGPDAGNGGDDAVRVCDSVLRAFEVGLLELHCDAPRFGATIPQEPVASPLARVLVEAAGASVLIPSLRPRMVALDDPVMRTLLPLMDGSRDHRRLLEDLAERMANLPSAPDRGRDAPTTAAGWRDALAPDLEEGLARIARMALLVGGD